MHWPCMHFIEQHWSLPKQNWPFGTHPQFPRLHCPVQHCWSLKHCAPSSAHVTHAMAVAAGVAREAHRPWVSAIAWLGASTVAWQRIHDDQHWLSDVGGASAIAIGAQQLVGRWHDRHARGGRDPVRVSIGVTTGMVVVRVR